MLQTSCHCGNIIMEVSHLPESLTSCNCSICQRLGALWAYYTPEQVNILPSALKTQPYLWGQKNIAFHHCPKCGCTTHYSMTSKSGSAKLAINARMMPPQEIKALPVKLFDGADRWCYLN